MLYFTSESEYKITLIGCTSLGRGHMGVAYEQPSPPCNAACCTCVRGGLCVMFIRKSEELRDVRNGCEDQRKSKPTDIFIQHLSERKSFFIPCEEARTSRPVSDVREGNVFQCRVDFI